MCVPVLVLTSAFVVRVTSSAGGTAHVAHIKLPHAVTLVVGVGSRNA